MSIPPKMTIALEIISRFYGNTIQECLRLYAWMSENLMTIAVRVDGQCHYAYIECMDTNYIHSSSTTSGWTTFLDFCQYNICHNFLLLIVCKS